jgi:hypothetical protein
MTLPPSLLPFFFVFLWSTGFIGAKFGLPYAEPLTFLLTRYLLVLTLMIPSGATDARAVARQSAAVFPYRRLRRAGARRLSGWRVHGHQARPAGRGDRADGRHAAAADRLRGRLSARRAGLSRGNGWVWRSASPG